MSTDVSRSHLNDVPTQMLTQREQNKIILTDEQWSNSFALNVVVEDYYRASNYRFQNHDWRWGNADELYLGWVPPRYWEGTKIPRANISVMTAYEQVEAMMPRIMQALFGDDPWFDASPVGNTKPSASRCSRDVILAQMHECRVRKVLRIALKSGFLYGNGVMEAFWHHADKQVIKYMPFFVPEKKVIRDPITGQDFPVPTGEYRRVIREIEENEYENRPILAPRSLKHFYIDPNCPTADPKDARYTIVRAYMATDKLAELRDIDGFDIPDDEELLYMARQKPYDQGDNTQSYQESARLGMWDPHQDQSLDPAAERIEILRYTTKRRVVWVANRKYILYNRPNPYKTIMQYNSFFTDLIDRFYGLSMADVTEGEQRLQEGILNGRLDELALNLHPPTTVRRGNTTPIYQLRSRPGAVNYSDDPKNDFIRQYTNNVTAQAFAEVNASDLRVQKITGLTDLAILGVSSGSNPGARSATGAGLQGQASFSRVQYQVENCEADVLEPILEDFHMMNNMHLDPNQMIEAVDGKMLDPLEVFGAKVKFQMRAGSRMQSRNGLLQILPLVLQNAMNPWLQEQLRMTGKTIDFEEVFQMVLDATGYRKKASWVRELSEQEMKMIQQQKPSKEMIDMQMQERRMTQMADMQLEKDEMALIREIIRTKGAVLLEKEKARLGGNREPAVRQR